MKPNPPQAGRPRSLRTPAWCAALALSTILLAAASSAARAQALMVGADGAVHLDQFQQVDPNNPVIIQQTPELIQPSIVAPGMAPAQFAAPAIAGCEPYGACVPFVPMTAPAVAQAAQQPLPIMFSVFGEFLYLNPGGVDMVHAQQQDGLGGAGTVPFGTIAANDFHYEPGVRVGGDMALSGTTSIAGTYTWFESNAMSSVEAPTTPGGTGAVGSLVHHPGAALTASPGPVDSRSVLNFQLADAELRARLHQGPRHWINGGLGLRYANLDQDFSQTGEFGGGLGGLIVTQTDADFEGGGARLSLDGGRSLGSRGLSLYARSSLSPLAGQFRSSYSLRNEDLDSQLALANWKDDRIMTLLDYEVGLAWTGPRKRWRFAAGYLQSIWFNAVTTNSFIPAVQTGDYSDVSDTILFDGLTARVEHLW